jgi:hypothetical protein
MFSIEVGTRSIEPATRSESVCSDSAWARPTGRRGMRTKRVSQPAMSRTAW